MQKKKIVPRFLLRGFIKVYIQTIFNMFLTNQIALIKYKPAEL